MNKIVIVEKKDISINKKYEDLQCHGKKYTIYTKSNRTYFSSEYATIELKTPVPHITNYGAFNIDYNSSTLVYFDSTPTQFVLYVYQW
jgi:hypothetical protein